MSVVSKVFVVADITKYQEVGAAAIQAISKWQRAKLDSAWQQNKKFIGRTDFLIACRKENPKPWSNGVNVNCSESLDNFQISFAVDGELRIVWYSTGCSCDTNAVVDDNTLSFSVGRWGMSEEIMQVVIEAIKPFGDVWYDHNDCDDEGYKKVSYKLEEKIASMD